MTVPKPNTASTELPTLKNLANAIGGELNVRMVPGNRWSYDQSNRQLIYNVAQLAGLTFEQACGLVFKNLGHCLYSQTKLKLTDVYDDVTKRVNRSAGAKSISQASVQLLVRASEEERAEHRLRTKRYPGLKQGRLPRWDSGYRHPFFLKRYEELQKISPRGAVDQNGNSLYWLRVQTAVRGLVSGAMTKADLPEDMPWSEELCKQLASLRNEDHVNKLLRKWPTLASEIAKARKEYEESQPPPPGGCENPPPGDSEGEQDGEGENQSDKPKGDTYAKHGNPETDSQPQPTPEEPPEGWGDEIEPGSENEPDQEDDTEDDQPSDKPEPQDKPDDKPEDKPEPESEPDEDDGDFVGPQGEGLDENPEDEPDESEDEQGDEDEDEDEPDDEESDEDGEESEESDDEPSENPYGSEEDDEPVDDEESDGEGDGGEADDEPEEPEPKDEREEIKDRAKSEPKAEPQGDISDEVKNAPKPKPDNFLDGDGSDLTAGAVDMSNYQHAPTWSEVASTIKPFIAPIRKQIERYLKENEYVDKVRGLRSGKFDARSAMAAQRASNDHAFSRREEKGERSFAVYLLVDTSGSMNSQIHGTNGFPEVFAFENRVIQAGQRVKDSEKMLAEALERRQTANGKRAVMAAEHWLKGAKAEEAKAIAQFNTHETGNAVYNSTRIRMATRMGVAIAEAMRPFTEVEVGFGGFSSAYSIRADGSTGYPHSEWDPLQGRYIVPDAHSAHTNLKHLSERISGTVKQNMLDWFLHLRGGGGTDILPSLQELRDEFRKSRAMKKMLIVLSDGDFGNDPTEIAKAIKDLNQDGVELVVLTVGYPAASAQKYVGEKNAEEITEDTIAKVLGKHLSRMVKE